MRDLIVLTVFNRQPWMLRNVLRQVDKNDLADTDILALDDGSTIDYGEFKDYPNVTWREVSTLKDRPGTYHINGHNNPAYVNNVAIDYAEEQGAERIFFLSSDTLIPPHTLTIARKVVDRGSVFTPASMDIDSGTLYHSTDKLWPMMWFAGMKVKDAVDCGGFDEEFLQGMAFEDNDFMGRLCLHVGQIEVHDRILALHQSHAPTAYSDDWKGFGRSEDYCKEKWGGFVPWRANGQPFQFKGVVQEGVGVYTVERVSYEVPQPQEAAG